VSGTFWFPGGGGDFNDPVRNSITQSYLSIFGRYGEPSGVEGYVNIWVYGDGPATYGSIFNMVRDGGDSTKGGSGELQATDQNGDHERMTFGTCPILGCTDPQANNYNNRATQDNGSCTYSPPSVSLSASPSSIIQGSCVTLSYSASGVGLYSASLTGVSNPGYSGPRTVCPSQTTTYTYTVCGTGGCSNASAIVTVYVPPVITLSLNKSSIIAGQCATLSWNTTGDASTIQWLSGNINNFNLTSSSTVCPLDTTIYTARVSGNGGQDTDTITLTVYQIPTLSVTTPGSLDYGVNGSFDYVSQYCDISLNVKIYYRYADGSPVLKTDTNITNASSSQLSASDNQTKVSGTIDLDIQYDDFGPRYIDVVMTATGSGGSVSISREIIINIDETPDNIVIPEKDDAFKSQDPVFAPEAEILSELLLVDDIDIPVEIKANSPIQVDVNKQNNWQNLRQL
jgi:hypothetical protein